MFQSLGSPNAFLLEQPRTNKGMMSFRNWPLGRSCSFGNQNNVSTNLFRREVHGTFLQRLNNPFGENERPQRLRMPVEDIISASALEAGNIFMGFTNCGRYLLSYTCRPTEHFGLGASAFDTDASYMYALHIWLFTPYSKLRKVCQVCLFDNSGVYDNNLLIEISQWHMDDSHLLITGHSANPDSEGHYTFYTTITTIPETRNCPNCVYMHDEELEEDVGSRLRTNCIMHGLTLHMKYDHVPPYPKLNPDVQLRFRDTVLLNTGNVIHMVAFKLIKPSPMKMEHGVVPAAGLPPNKTTKVPLFCDIWFKIPNANMGALAKVKLVVGKSGEHDEQNIVSLNALDRLLSLFPTSTTSKNSSLCASNVTVEIPASVNNRRLFQSSTDSEFSIFSPKSVSYCDSGPPMSPPFLNKPRSPRHGNGEIASAQTIGTNNVVSPSKLMLPPQERKFFKRRLSSQCLGSSLLLSNSNGPTSAPDPNPSPSPNLHSPIKSVEITATASTEPEPSNEQQTQSAFDVFEMRLEDTAVERHLSSFKTFSKHRLADKKYEFSDSDVSAENIVPLKMTRRKPKYSQMQSFMASQRSPRGENSSVGNESPRGNFPDTSHPRSPRAYPHFVSPVMSPNYESSFSDVLRPLNNNSKIKVPALSPNNHQCTMDADDIKMKEDDFNKAFKGYASQPMEKGMKKLETVGIPNHPHSKATISVHVNCIAKVLRSYIQKEDDNMSVITDIEDELCQGYPFPVALPLDVHGAGYQQLQMISNSKADRFMQVPVVQVLQRTLDIEMLCNEVANLICLASDKLYCSCVDFDLTFADADPDRGTVTAIVVMLVQAMSLKSRNRLDREKCIQVPRKKYETFFACEWTPCTEYCRILYRSNLKELETVPDPWHPTEDMESLIKSHLTVSPPKKTLSNALAVHDWQSLDELVDTGGIVTLFKEEDSARLNDRRLNDFENNIEVASFASTTDSEDDWGNVM